MAVWDVVNLKPSSKGHTCQTHPSFAAELHKSFSSCYAFGPVDDPIKLPLIEVNASEQVSLGHKLHIPSTDPGVKLKEVK